MTVAAVYARVPGVACKGLCQEACGPIACSAAEANAMRESGINPPGLRDHPKYGAYTCSHLTDGGKCSAYEHRPLVCRLFGAVRALSCPHGCKPVGGYLTDTDARAMVGELHVLSGGGAMHVATSRAAL